MKKIFLAVLLFFCCYPLMAQSSYSLKVGQHKFVTSPTPPMNGVIQNANWGCNNINVVVENGSAAGATVYIKHYFTGTASVEVWYNYLSYDNYGNPHVGNGTHVVLISCIAQNATLSNSNIKLEVGENHKLDVNMSNYGGYTPSWKSDNVGVASVDSSGFVQAKAVGNTTIYCDPVVGPEVSCTVQVEQSTSNNGNNNEESDDNNNNNSGDDTNDDTGTGNSSGGDSNIPEKIDVGKARERIFELRNKTQIYLNE